MDEETKPTPIGEVVEITEEDLADDGLQKKPVDKRIEEMGRTTVQRETLSTLRKIARSLDMLALIGALAMCFWAGTKFSAIASVTDFSRMVETAAMLFVAVIFTWLGITMPKSDLRQELQKITDRFSRLQ